MQLKLIVSWLIPSASESLHKNMKSGLDLDHFFICIAKGKDIASQVVPLETLASMLNSTLLNSAALTLTHKATLQGKKMKARLTYYVMTLVLISGPLLAEEGKVLYEKSCTKCHGTEVFTREDRGVKSLEELKIRVKQCSLAAESKWIDKEIKIVTEYLNKNYYRF